MPEIDLIFKVIAHEKFPDFNPHYLYARKYKDSNWKNNEIWFDSLEEIGRNIAREIIGTKSDYLITSGPLNGKSGVEHEGIEGYSGDPDSGSIVRKLSEQENRMLCGNLAKRIRDHQIRKTVENLD